MIEEIRNIKSGKAELMKFGISMGVISILAGLYLLFKAGDYYIYFFILSIVFFVLGFKFSIVLYPLQKLWMIFAVIMGWIMSRVVLIVVFYSVVTLIGLAARLVGKDFLEKKIDPGASTYWIKRGKRGFNKESLENQF